MDSHSLWEEFERECSCNSPADDFVDEDPKADSFLGENTTSDFMDSVQDDYAADMSSSSLMVTKKRKVGRPRGTFGNQLARQKNLASKEALEEQRLAAEPTGIEYARQFRRKTTLKTFSSKSVQPATSDSTMPMEFSETEASSPMLLSSRSPIWENMAELGSPLQAAIVTAARHSFQHQDKSDRETGKVSDMLDLKAQAVACLVYQKTCGFGWFYFCVYLFH